MNYFPFPYITNPFPGIPNQNLEQQIIALKKEIVLIKERLRVLEKKEKNDYLEKEDGLYCRRNTGKGWLSTYLGTYDIEISNLNKDVITYKITSYYAENQIYLGQQQGIDGKIQSVWEVPQKMKDLKKEDIEEAKTLEEAVKAWNRRIGVKNENTSV